MRINSPSLKCKYMWDVTSHMYAKRVSVGQGNCTWSVAEKNGSLPTYELDKTLWLHLYEWTEENRDHMLVLRSSNIACMLSIWQIFFPSEELTIPMLPIRNGLWSGGLCQRTDSGSRLTLIYSNCLKIRLSIPTQKSSILTGEVLLNKQKKIN